MTRLITLFVLLFMVATLGCSRSLDVAQNSFDRANVANQELRHGLFTQAWGLNRAVITESRQKFMARTELALVDASENGKVDLTKARSVINSLEQELGRDETVTSQNFAYLAFLLMAGERADAMMGNVDYYLSSQTPIWKALVHGAEAETQVVQNEWKKWEPLLGQAVENVKNVLEKLGAWLKVDSVKQ